MPAETVTSTIIATSEPAPHVRELTLAAPEGGMIPFRPGQWLSLHLPVGEHPPLVRAYSLAEPMNAAGTLTLCFDRVDGGAGSEYLFHRAIGDPVTFAPAALGNFVVPPEVHAGEADLVLVGRFTGIVPLRCMILDRTRPDAPAPPPRVRLIYGALSPADLAYHAQLSELAAHVGWLDYHPIVQMPTPDWFGLVGDELDALRLLRAEEWPQPYVPMVVGVREFTKPVRAYFQELGFTRRTVKCENFNGV